VLYRSGEKEILQFLIETTAKFLPLLEMNFTVIIKFNVLDGEKDSLGI
jgi:hypothetical protein